MAYYRQNVVNIIKSWLGKNVADGSFRTIVDTYNSIYPLPVGYRLQYSDAWCAATYSAAFHAAGYDAICPSECSCPRMIEKAKSLGIWVENDAYIPAPGDAVLYDWQDNGAGDNVGTADHVGMVVNVEGNKIYVVEGNVNDSVVTRVIGVNSQYIRGFVAPKFDEVAQAPQSTPISNASDIKAGDVVKVKNAVTYNGQPFVTYRESYNVLEVKNDRAVIGIGSTITAAVNVSNLEKISGTSAAPVNIVSPITKAEAPLTKVEDARGFDKGLAKDYTCTDGLNLRCGAGTNKPIIVCMPKGTVARCFGYFTQVGSTKWLCVNAVVNGITYKGFCSSEYLR
ncbi:MAG: CHAP domain-containing protein [archaeon]|nr:CHAP domain-containing protein [archaeon]